MKSYIKISLILLLSIINCPLSICQTVLVIDGNQVVQEGSYWVIENAKLVNNSTYKANSGTVVIKGDANTNNTTIGGSSATHFSVLNINKSANNVLLENHISVEDTLYLTSGLLELSDYNVLISDVGAFSDVTENTYVKTSGTGTVQRKVSTSYIDFPVGDNTYSPIAIQNTGSADTLGVRSESAVYQDGTSGNILTENAVNNSWHISENTEGGSTANIIFQWYGSEELTNFDRSNSNVAFYDGTQWMESTNSAASGGNPYLKFFNGITNLGTFAIVSDGANLPVELLYFYGEKVDAGVQLHWETATEINNSHFDVEWSKDGISFQKIGEVAGAGTTNEVQFYEFFDDLNHVGFENRHSLHYYRLKQHDYDGKYEYTNTINITIEQSNNITINIFPNPATSYFKIETDYQGLIQLFSATGQLIFEREITENQNWDISTFPRGTYFLKIGDAVKRVLIQ